MMDRFQTRAFLISALPLIAALAALCLVAAVNNHPGNNLSRISRALDLEPTQSDALLPNAPYTGSDAIENYRESLSTAMRGKVSFFPPQGVPSVVTVTVSAPISKRAAEQRAAYAWHWLAAARRCAVGSASAGHCMVRFCDLHGKFLASVNHPPSTP